MSSVSSNAGSAQTAQVEATSVDEMPDGLTLGDLLARDELGLRLLSGGRGSQQRPIGPALVIDASDSRDLDLLEPGCIVLTSRISRDADDDQLRALVRELRRRQVSALGVSLRAAGERIPRALVEEALAAALPVFTVPATSSCEQLARFIGLARLRGDQDRLRQSLAAQEYLMDGVREQRPADAIVRKLGHLLGGSALLFNDGGQVVTATGAAHPDQVWAQIRARAPVPQQFDVADHHVTSVPIRVDQRVCYWLVALTSRQIASAEASRSILRTAERLLELVALAYKGAEADEQARRSELLATALAEREPRQLREVAHRAARFGITFADPCRVMIVRYPGAPARPADAVPTLAALAERLRGRLADRCVPYLLDEQANRLVALLQGTNEAVDGWVADLAREGIDLVVGFGREHHSIEVTRDSLLDAQLAVQQIDRQPGGAVLRFEHCALTRWILGAIAPEQLAPKVAAVLAPLKAEPRLYETLVALLDADLNLAKTAAALHLHVNSVRYRLGRIEEILCRPIHHASTLADLYLAVTAERAVLANELLATDRPRTAAPAA